MPKIWKIKEKITDNLIEQLAFNRGLKTDEEKEKFFKPSIADYSKELNIQNIEKAFGRIQKAIDAQELIVVYGDYDIDGVTASAVLYKALTSLGAKVLPYIPHRDKEGYGLSITGLDFARNSGATVVITVDNGIVAIEQAKYAKQLGIDLIITDHHLPSDEKPDCYTIVHSTKMCGAAVAWCLIREKVSKKLSEELLQFVGIATIGDQIPLVGLGRAFVYEGLKQLNRTTNLGLISLINECGLTVGQIGAYEIGHGIGPKINAIGRLQHAIDALRLLCTQDPVKAKRLSKLLCETNLERQRLTTIAIDEAKLQLKKNTRINVLFSKNWHSGIIGLIAGRISEETYLPTVTMSIAASGKAKGSARSIEGINIAEVIRKHTDILIDVGGHSGAAGFSIEETNIEIFMKRLEKDLEEIPAPSESYIDIEAVIETNKLTKNLALEIQKFAPFGFDNPDPVLGTLNMKITDIKTVGVGKHLKFKAEGIDAIAFGKGDMQPLLKSGQLVNLAYYLEINKFNGRENLQLKVKDIQLS